MNAVIRASATRSGDGCHNFCLVADNFKPCQL
jgi:hypothetical protein